MTSMPMIGSPACYRTPAAHLEDEVRWVRARCIHLAEKLKAEREAEKQAHGLVTAELAGVPAEAKRRIAHLATCEANVRAEIDARLAASRGAGVELGFDDICTGFALDSTERAAVLLCTIPALGYELGEVLGTIAAFGYAIMSVTPETVAVFCGLDLEGRIDLRRRLGPSGKLIRGGVVRIEMPNQADEQDFPGASLFVQTAAFRQIVGLEPDVGRSCYACGQSIDAICRRPEDYC